MKVGSITTTTQILLDNNRCTILLVLVIPVIQSTHFFFSDTRAVKILLAADGLNWSQSLYSLKHLPRISLLMPLGGPNIEPQSDRYKTPFCVVRCLLSRIIATTAVLLRVCIVMGMLLHSNGHL
jgi:hypothetical protein